MDVLFLAIKILFILGGINIIFFKIALDLAFLHTHNGLKK
jgi:hypothetical protein